MAVTVASPAPNKVIAEVSTPATSKINWTAAVGFLASVAALFGLDISPDTQKIILEAITLIGFPLIAVLRTWFTNKQPSVG